MKKTFRAKLGQNTAEYLIMLTLVAVGTIPLIGAFGKTLHTKIGQVSSAIGGDKTNYDTAKTNVNTAAEKAQTEGKDKVIEMNGIDQNDLESRLAP